jgi:MFS family permease
MTTGVAASHAYTADCTPPAARARIFSLSLGLLFIGMALGPTLGSFLIAGTGSVLSVFYVASVLHICYSSFIWFVLPESLTRSAMMKSRRRYASRLEEEGQKMREREARGGIVGRPRLGSRVVGAVMRSMKKVFAFMSPLSVFAPMRDETYGKSGKRDWSLTFLAAGYGFYTMVMVCSTFRLRPWVG